MSVYVVEGEKDVDALVAAGAVATCNSGGAGKWSTVAEDARSVLAGRNFVVVADRDAPGVEHAHAFAAHVGAGSDLEQLVVLASIDAGGEPLEEWLTIKADDDDSEVERPPRIAFREIADPFVVPPLEWHAKGLLVRSTHGELAGVEKSLKSLVNFDIGRFNTETNEHEGRIIWSATNTRDSGAGDGNGQDGDSDKLGAARQALVNGWKRRRGGNRDEPLTQTEWFALALAPGHGTDIRRQAFVQLRDEGRIAEREVEIVDKAGATRRKWRFELVESAFEIEAA